MYHYGLGTPQSTSEAIHYYEMSIKYEENASYPANTMISLIDFENANLNQITYNFIQGLKEYITIDNPFILFGIGFSIFYVFLILSLLMQPQS